MKKFMSANVTTPAAVPQRLIQFGTVRETKGKPPQMLLQLRLYFDAIPHLEGFMYLIDKHMGSIGGERKFDKAPDGEATRDIRKLKKKGKKKSKEEEEEEEDDNKDL